ARRSWPMRPATSSTASCAATGNRFVTGYTQPSHLRHPRPSRATPGAMITMNGHLMPDITRTQAFISGDFVDAADGATFDSLAPATGKVIAQIAACGDVDVERAVSAARTAFESGRWSSLAPAARKSVLMDFADLIEAKTDELALLESLDAGKPI